MREQKPKIPLTVHVLGKKNPVIRYQKFDTSSTNICKLRLTYALRTIWSDHETSTETKSSTIKASKRV